MCYSCTDILYVFYPYSIFLALLFMCLTAIQFVADSARTIINEHDDDDDDDDDIRRYVYALHMRHMVKQMSVVP